MRVCGKCIRRLILWITLTAASISIALRIDLSLLGTGPFPLPVRVAGLTGVLLVHPLMKRSGRLLKSFGDCELWGWSRRLITWDICGCVRHPHHLGVGLFMTSLGLAIGYPVTLLVIAISQWAWAVLFVILVEERECKQKFGDEYLEYRRRVPMFLANPVCLARALRRPITDRVPAT
jgi:protein-S-isoprenylcysteine O-methyltransferase Ste14